MSSGGNKNSSLEIKMRHTVLKLLVGGLILTGCSAPEEEFKQHTRFVMNTYVSVTVPENISKDIIEQGFKKIIRMDKEISSFRGKNRIDPNYYNLIKDSLKLAEKIDGFYDPTVYPVLQAWGFYGENYRVPDKGELSSVLQKTGYSKVEYKAGNIKAPEYIKFDLGGFAKGWVVDRMVEYFKEKGIETGLVDAGGDIRGWGDRIWRIGIKLPRAPGLAGVVKIKNSAVATSGDYENYFEYKGKRYSHIINPKTGYPSEGIYSATVIAEDCAKADGLSTALFAARGELIDIVEYLSIGCAIIGEDRTYTTPGLNIDWE